MSTIQNTPTRGFHPAHVGHLVMGLAFLGLVAIWGAVESGVVETDNVRWLLPLPWVFAGLAGLLAVLFSGRGRQTPEPVTAPAYPASPDTTPATSAPQTTALDTELEADQHEEQS